MLTVDDVAAVPLFAELPAAELQRLARTSADLRLAPGEFAVPEGGERALFAVLSGKIEVVKTIDGIERRLGFRVPGAIFGEVPIALGTPFPGGYRAVEPSRVMRIDPQEYYAVAAVSKDISLKVSALARERMGGLQSITAEPPTPRVTVVGHRWDTVCADVRRFLARNQISLTWLTPEAPELAATWHGPAPADCDLPVLRLADGQVLVRPEVRDLAVRLGLQTNPSAKEYDVAIIGGGPAGLAAAVYGASEGLRTIVIEREAPGGQAGTSARIENYLGFPSGVSGDELASRALQQARRLGAEILVTRSVVRVDPAAREVFLDGGDVVRARTLILATGVAWRRLAVDGHDRLIGKGVYYGAARSEVGATHGLDIHLVGAGNSAGQAALNCANHARQVTLLVRGESLGETMSHYLTEKLHGKSNIEVRLRSEVQAVHGDTHLTAIDVRDVATDEVRREECGGLFIFIGADAETGWLPDEIARDARGYVLTGEDLKKAGRWSHRRDPYLLETSVPGVFACGDVRLSPIKRVAAAVGEGSMAIALVLQFLAHEDTPTAVARDGATHLAFPPRPAHDDVHMSAEVTVLVVGAGPTGLLLASELQRRGVACRLIDANPAPQHWDRATVVHPRSLEVFESLGLFDAFLDAGVKQRFARLHSDGAVLGEIDLTICGSRYGFNLGISEEVTERILTDYLNRQGGELVRGSRLVGLQPNGRGLVATIARDGATEEVSTQWVVGCDGVHSTTRELGGIELAGHDIAEPWAVFDVTLTGWSDPYEAIYVFMDEPPVILTALPGQRWRVYLRPSAAESDLLADARATILRYRPGLGFDDIENPVRFHCHTKVATRYRADRILLAGDAAHVCSPFQGHGMNTGLQDAFNLAWKLALVCQGHSAPGILDSYEAERRPVAQVIAASGDEVEHAQTLTDPVERRARDVTLRATFADPRTRHHEAIAEAELDIDYGPSPIVTGDAHPTLGPGQRLPDTIAVRLANGDARGLHELAHRAGHTALLLGGVSSRDDDLARLANALRAGSDRRFVETTVVVSTRADDPHASASLAPESAAQLGVDTATLLVVRPDGHVGLRADRDHVQALAAYQSLLASGRRGS